MLPATMGVQSRVMTIALVLVSDNVIGQGKHSRETLAKENHRDVLPGMLILLRSQ